MALPEKLQVVELNAANEVVVLLDLNDGVHLLIEAGTFTPIPPEKTQIMAQDQRRYGGARQVGETTGLGGIEWVAGVSGATEQAALERLEQVLTQLEANPFRSFLLWQVAGASQPTLYEMRGTAVWTPKPFTTAQWEGAQFWPIQLHIPVAPLAQALPVEVFSKGAIVLPAVCEIANIPGDAPAKAEVSIQTASNTVKALLITGASTPLGVAVNSEHIFFTNNTTGFIGRATLAGTSVEQTWLNVGGAPTGVAVDSTFIYWTTQAGTIGRAKLAGTSIEKTFISGLSQPEYLAVNASNIFWTSGTHIGRAAIGGGTVEAAWLATGVNPVVGLAVNASNIFWTEPIAGAIGRATLAGGSVTDSFITGASYPYGIACDATFLYWSDAQTGCVARALLAGTEADENWLQTTATFPRGIAVDSEHVFWTAIGGDIGRAGVIGTTPPIFGLLAWAAKPSSGLATAPFGVLDSTAENETLSGWTYGTVAGARGGSALHGTAKLNAATWSVDPATMVPDSFSGELAVEVFARVLLSAGLEAATLTLSAMPAAGAGYGAPRWTDEWGSRGAPMTLPEGTAKWRMTRLGVLHLLVNPLAPRTWKLQVQGTATENAEWGLDYLLLAPALQRACSPTSKVNNASYPPFIASVGPTVKTVRSDLSGHVAIPNQAAHPDNGLGGQLLQLPPGEVDLLVKLSSLVPDSPALSTASEQLSHEALVSVWVTPRFQLVRTV